MKFIIHNRISISSKMKYLAPEKKKRNYDKEGKILAFLLPDNCSCVLVGIG